MEAVVTVGGYLLIIVVGVFLSLAVFRTPRYSESEYQISTIGQYVLKSASFGRGRMDRTAFFLGHIIALGAGFVIAGIFGIFGDVFDFDLAAMLSIFGGFICFFLYGWQAMILRFVDMRQNTRWVGWIFFPGFGQLLWLVLFVACVLTPGTDE